MIKKYYSENLGSEIDQAVNKITEMWKDAKPITQSEYNDIAEKKNVLYFIVDYKGELQRIFFADVLIAKRSTDSKNVGFPYTFPITFS